MFTRFLGAGQSCNSNSLCTAGNQIVMYQSKSTPAKRVRIVPTNKAGTTTTGTDGDAYD